MADREICRLIHRLVKARKLCILHRLNAWLVMTCATLRTAECSTHTGGLSMVSPDLTGDLTELDAVPGT
jgi:hypothetical protein